MSGDLATAALFALAAGAAYVMTALAVSAGVALGRGRLAAIEPVSRHRLLTSLALAPAVVAVAVAVACALPPLLGADHCSVHAGHPHLCLVHGAGTSVGALAVVLVGVGVGAVAIGAVRELAGVWRGARIAAGLVRASRPAGTHRVVDAGAPFSITAGLARPVVLVSRGLVDRLDTDELGAVIAHERSHAARRDALRMLVVRLATCGLPGMLVRPLLEEAGLAAEQAADVDAARAVGDPLLVANAIVSAARALARNPSGAAAVAVGFGPRAVDRRVRALLDPPARRTRLGAVVVLAVAAGLLVGFDPVHHATETLLGAVAE